MSELTNIGLAEFVKGKIGVPYVYGMKGTVMTEANYNYLFNKYGSDLVWTSDRKKIGRVCVDCSGLISWYTGKLKGSSQYRAESDPQPISTISKAPVGVAVWRQGHIGVYIGNGEIIEAMGSAYGVVKTRVKDRDFTHWFKLKDVEYVERDDEMAEKDKVIVDGKEYDMEMIRKDGITYIKTRDIAEALGLKVGNKGRIPVLEKK